MKNIDHVLKLLGSEYSISWFDLERIIYRRIDMNCEIEISGLDNYKKKKLKPIIFIWLYGWKSFRFDIDINSIDELALKINEIIEKYNKKELI